MLDEEKKAELKSLIEEYEICFKESKYEGNSEEYKSLKGTYKLLKDILNLIEKQSKQIKELKENNRKYIVQLTYEQYKKLVDVIRAEINKEWIDKINLKIEELYETKQYWNNEVIKILNKIKGDEN